MDRSSPLSTLPSDVAFFGLGVMGRPMVDRLVASQVVVHVVARASHRDLPSGVVVHPSSAEAVRAASIAITMLPDGPDVESLGLASDGILESMPPGGLWIDASTISPTTSADIARMAEVRSVDFVDAPVSGGQEAARRGSLSVMAGGTDAAVSRALPILGLLAGRITHVGPSGAGQIAKAVNQIIVGGTVVLVAEGLNLARVSGLDPSVVRAAIQSGFASSRVLDVQGERILARMFEPGFRAALQLKDLDIGLALAARVGAAVPMTAQAALLYRALLDRPDSEGIDQAGVVLVLEDASTDSPRQF